MQEVGAVSGSWVLCVCVREAGAACGSGMLCVGACERWVLWVREGCCGGQRWVQCVTGGTGAGQEPGSRAGSEPQPCHGVLVGGT